MLSFQVDDSEHIGGTKNESFSRHTKTKFSFFFFFVKRQSLVTTTMILRALFPQRKQYIS